MSAPSLAKPRTLRDGRYTLLRSIGAGSQAETYEARDQGTVGDRPAPGELLDEWQRYVARARRGDTPRPQGLVAIKCFHVGKAKAWKDVELAEREARTLASLSHPNLPRYIEHFEEDGALYLVMEMVEGETLAALRSRQRTTSVADVTRMVHDIGDALRYLHGRVPPVVHRDIKPGNIIRRHDGSYALVDFGAVAGRLKPEGGSTVVGTFGYMAPEQFQGRASPRSDLYGLGATALVMLTGVEPEDLPHVGLGIDVAQAAPRSAPPALVRALASMLIPDPDRRASSIDEALAFRTEPPNRSKRGKPEPELRGEARALRAQRKREARDERRRERAVRRSRRAAPRFALAKRAALLAVLMVVLGVVGLRLPDALLILLPLTLLAAVFGGALRRAATAWLPARREKEAPPPRVRVGAPSDQVRVHEDGESAHDAADEPENAEETSADEVHRSSARRP